MRTIGRMVFMLSDLFNDIIPSVALILQVEVLLQYEEIFDIIKL